jgi:hypothetical protein
MVQRVATVALVAQVVTVLEPDYRLLLRPDIQQRIKLSPAQRQKMNKAMRTAENAYSKMPSRERTMLSNDPVVAKEALVMPAMHTLGLDKAQKSYLIAVTVESYGPFILRMPGMEYHLRINQKQKLGINRDFTDIVQDFDDRFVQQARKSKTKFMPGGAIPITPPFQVIRAERDRLLWNTLLKHLTGPQIMKIIVARKSDPWSASRPKL